MLRSLVFAGAMYFVTAFMLVSFSFLLFCPRSWAMAALKLHARISLWLLKVITQTKMEVRGLENLPKGPVLVVAKHQSAWDTFGLIPLFKDPAIILKDELKWIPFYGWFCLKFEHILVKRQKASLALKGMIKDAKKRVSQGRQILIFPEGTRRTPGAPPTYKSGYLALYEELGVPCIPLALNSGLFWPRRQIKRFPGTIIVEFLPPLPPRLPRQIVKEQIETAIENASTRLLEEALLQPQPPPRPKAE
ncbi:MAG: lysophospholipid acyltransferase family protein [Hyphomicrobium sp.]